MSGKLWLIFVIMRIQDTVLGRRAQGLGTMGSEETNDPDSDDEEWNVSKADQSDEEEYSGKDIGMGATRPLGSSTLSGVKEKLASGGGVRFHETTFDSCEDVIIVCKKNGISKGCTGDAFVLLNFGPVLLG